MTHMSCTKGAELYWVGGHKGRLYRGVVADRFDVVIQKWGGPADLEGPNPSDWFIRLL